MCAMNDSNRRVSCEPRKPLDSDCCGQGCHSCVFDIYEDEMKIWRNENAPVPSNSQNLVSRDTYVSCRIDRIERHRPNVFEFNFITPDDTDLEFAAGQHVIFKEQMDETSSISRPYTIVSKPGRVKEFTLLIKLYDNGIMSKIISSRWKEGYFALCRGPFGDLNYTANKDRCVTLIAAGTGIVPLYQLAKTIVDNDNDETRVKLIYCSKSYEDIILRTEIHRLQSYWNFSCQHYLDGGITEASLSKKHDEIVNYCKLTEDMLHKETCGMPIQTRFYVCGPRNFEKDMVSYLKRFGYHQIEKL